MLKLDKNQLALIFAVIILAVVLIVSWVVRKASADSFSEPIDVDKSGPQPRAGFKPRNEASIIHTNLMKWFGDLRETRDAFQRLLEYNYNEMVLVSNAYREMFSGHKYPTLMQLVQAEQAVVYAQMRLQVLERLREWNIP